MNTLLASHGLEEPLFVLLCNFFSGGKQILVLHTTYVLRVPQSCGVWLVFLVLAGNSFWCYVHTQQCTIQLCGCVSFLAGNRFQFYILIYLEYNAVVVLCQFFGSGGKQFLTLCMYLVYNTFVRFCHFFWLWREIVLKMRTRFYKKILLGYFIKILQPM